MVQSLFPALTRVRITKSNFLKARVIIYAYNQHVRLLPPEPLIVGQPKSTRIKEPAVLIRHFSPEADSPKIVVGVETAPSHVNMRF